MAESSNTDAAVFGLKVKLRPSLNFQSDFFQLELNDLFLVIQLSFGSSGIRYPFAASFTSIFLLSWALFS
jgi:hypothetical protein